jgi:hypothetical protein
MARARATLRFALSGPPPSGAPAKAEPIPQGEHAAVGDHRRFPGCRLEVVCGLCGWSKSYRPERVIERLTQLRAGGHDTRLTEVAARVAWPCPGCGRVKWKARFAWPAELGEREIRRLAALYRS